MIGNAGGPLILATDAASANGLEVVELSGELRRRLRALVPEAASVDNPVDLLATVTSSQLLRVLEAIADSGEVDACVVVSVNLAGEETAPLELDWSHPLVPAAAVLFAGASGAGSMPRYPTPSVPSKPSPWPPTAGPGWPRPPTTESRPHPPTSWRCAAAPVLALDHTPEHEWLGLDETMTLLGELGLPVAPWAAAASAAACAREARRIGFPCVLKADVAGVVHKSEAGAVVVASSPPPPCAARSASSGSDSVAVCSACWSNARSRLASRCSLAVSVTRRLARSSSSPQEAPTPRCSTTAASPSPQ